MTVRSRSRRGGSMVTRRAAVVAVDIVGHASAREDIMLARVGAINQIVRSVLDKHQPGSVLWSSGGDGSYLLFLNERWHSSVLDLLYDLRTWADRGSVPLRMAAHYGQLAFIAGTDGRQQPLGDGIDTAAWMLTKVSSAGNVVSSEFRAAFGQREGVEFHDRRPLRLKHGRSHALYLMSLIGAPRSRWCDQVDDHRPELDCPGGRGDEEVDFKGPPSVGCHGWRDALLKGEEVRGLMQHVVGCAACSALASQLEEIRRLAAGLEAAPVPDGLLGRVLATTCPQPESTVGRPQTPLGREVAPLVIDAPYVGPETDVEQVLAKIWAEVLGVDRVGVNDDFFDLGGDSISSIRVISKVRDAFEVQVPVRALFEAPTVAELAEQVEASAIDAVLATRGESE